jgi:hypothetical protein
MRTTSPSPSGSAACRLIGVWQIAECVAGAAHGTKMEITSGLAASQRVIGRGAILLKPRVVPAVARAGSRR